MASANLATAYKYWKTWGSYGSEDNQFLDLPGGTYVRKIDTVYNLLGVAVNPANNNVYAPVLVPHSPGTIYKIRVYNAGGTLLAVKSMPAARFMS